MRGVEVEAFVSCAPYKGGDTDTKELAVGVEEAATPGDTTTPSVQGAEEADKGARDTGGQTYQRRGGDLTPAYLALKGLKEFIPQGFSVATAARDTSASRHIPPPPQRAVGAPVKSGGPRLNLRPYQAAAIEAIRTAYVDGRRSVLAVLPTGTGKTVVFAEIARRAADKGGRALILAHRAELLEQAAGKLRAVGVEPGLEQGDAHAAGEAVVLASVQTLRGARLARMAEEPFGLVVIDEAHHATAAGYRAILGAFPTARVLGVTATPDRLDGAALGEVFEHVAYRYELADAIRDGYLARIEARRIRLAVDLDAVHTRAGDLDVGELEEAYGSEAAIRGVVEPLLELADNRRAILFAVSVAHAEALATRLNDRTPGTARAVSGSTPPVERAALVEAFRAGAFRVLVNCALFTEGFDCPEVEVVAIARPTKSRALFAQMVGRGTRLLPGKASCLVLDFTGNTRRHRLVTPAEILAGPDAAPELLATAEFESGDVLAALDRLARERETQAIEQAERARLRFWADAVDVFGVQVSDLGGDLVTARQREALERAGVDVPPELTRESASALLDAIHARREQGLASYKQVRLLAKFGIDAREMPFALAVNEIGRQLEARKLRKHRGTEAKRARRFA